MAITYHISKNHETEGKLMQLSFFSFVVLFLSFFFCFVFFALFFCFACSVISNLNMCNFASSSKDTRSDFVQIAAPKRVFLLRCNAILYDFLRDHFRYHVFRKHKSAAKNPVEKQPVFVDFSTIFM